MREEAIARDLVAKLAVVGLEARAGGAGVHWQVDVGPAGTRSLVVHCFWYEREFAGLVLGLNPSNSRSRLRTVRPASEGTEFLVILRDGTTRIADGRTGDIEDAVTCARLWMAGEGLDELVRKVSFVDVKRRAMQALADKISPGLRREIGGDPTYELWVYGEGRSCKLESDDGAPSCSFLIGQAQVARAAATSDARCAVAAWLLDRLPVRALAARLPEVVLEHHAEVLETDPARWHWLDLRDRIANPDDVLAPLRDLIDLLASSPIATKFYSYSSLSQFCFSASSHYPWVDRGLPVVAPLDGRTYLIAGERCDAHRAIQVIETTLSAYPIHPFFGSAPHHDLPAVTECLARQGSALRPRLVQKGAWYELVVEDVEQTRRCVMSDRSATFDGGHLSATWPTLADAVRAVRRYCEDGASLDEIAADPGADSIFRHRPTF